MKHNTSSFVDSKAISAIAHIIMHVASGKPAQVVPTGISSPDDESESDCMVPVMQQSLSPGRLSGQHSVPPSVVLQQLSAGH